MQSRFLVEAGPQTRALFPFQKPTAAGFAVILNSFSYRKSISVVTDVLYTTKMLNLHAPLTEEIIAFSYTIKLQPPQKLYAVSKYLK